MEYVIVCLAALSASALTFFSGFGLGTILMPVFAVFFPVPVAVAATALVHLANNIFKLFLVGRFANKKIVLRFSIPAVIAAFLGASLLTVVSSWPPLTAYQLGNRIHEVTVVKLVMGSIIVIFSCLELIPAFNKMSLDQKYLPVGGMLSGFFGGLSGHQGALRSMFLIKAGLNKEEFIGTNVVSAVMVDLARLLVYGVGFYATHINFLTGISGLVVAASVAAFIGAFFGKKIVEKLTIHTVHSAVGIMLMLLGIALGAALI